MSVITIDTIAPFAETGGLTRWPEKISLARVAMSRYGEDEGDVIIVFGVQLSERKDD